MTDEIGLPAFLADVPATARIAWDQLDRADDPLATDDLCRACRCSRRTARKAIVDLDEAGLVERANPLDQKTPKWRAVRPE